jgi:hypothetical protein
MYRMAALPSLLLLPALLLSGESRPETRAAAVAPFLDEQTIALAHLDLTRIDLAATVKWVAEAGRLKAGQAQYLEETFDLGAVKRVLGELTRAGARDFYLLFSLEDVPQTPFVVVPVPEGGDAGKIRDQLQKILSPYRKDWRAALLGHCVVGGAERTLKRLQDLRPAARPEIAEALAAAGDTTAQFLLLPTADLRRVFGEMMPNLPGSVGGGSSKPLTQGLRWAALGVDLPPRPAVRLVLQSSDETTARQLQRLLADVARGAGQLPAMRRTLPEYEKLSDLLSSKVEDNRVVVSLNAKTWKAKIPQVIARLTPATEDIRLSTNMRRIVLAMQNYADSNRGTMPAHAIYSNDGKPLLSWRVQLLPYLEQEKLYQQFHLDEPWDSEHNKKLMEKMPDVYHGLNAKQNREGKTIFVVPVGPQAAFPVGPKGLKFPASFLDGTSNTVLVVTIDDAFVVSWTRPEDLRFDSKHPAAGLGRLPRGHLVGMADGSVKFLSATIDPASLLPAFTPAGGEVLPRGVFAGD